MPKRIVDGDALWKSKKLNEVRPLKYRGELANMFSLSMVYGSFEADPRLIWAQVYSYNRPDVTVKQVEAMLSEFERVRILFRWKDAGGKVWGHWVGSLKTGRAVPQSQIKGSVESRGPLVPMDALTEFLGSPSVASSYARPTPDEPQAYPCTGPGSGIGDGSSKGLSIRNVISTGPVDIPASSSLADSFRLDKTDQPKDTSSSKTEQNSPTVSSFPKHSIFNDEAQKLVELFYELVQRNPSFEKTPKNWEHLWAEDFTKLLNLECPA